tara:strand:+ start:52 stop:381 length:330 start_codon:yes stop_codon:yes gene_type:complete
MGDLMQKLDDKKNEFEAWVKEQPPAVRAHPFTRTFEKIPKTCTASAPSAVTIGFAHSCAPPHIYKNSPTTSQRHATSRRSKSPWPPLEARFKVRPDLHGTPGRHLDNRG